MKGWDDFDTAGGVKTYIHKKYGFVSICFKSRTACIGICKPYVSNSIVPSVQYKGVGWKVNLIVDAQLEAERF
jgi:hypothetical protein